MPPLEHQSQTIAFQSCTVTWPQDRGQNSVAPSAASTPRQKFVLLDLSLKFPESGLTLICGKLGSGKTLLLLGELHVLFPVDIASKLRRILALLGEADILTGQLFCPRSPPNAIALYTQKKPDEEWVVKGLCAYVPQVRKRCYLGDTTAQSMSTVGMASECLNQR